MEEKRKLKKENFKELFESYLEVYPKKIFYEDQNYSIEHYQNQRINKNCGASPKWGTNFRSYSDMRARKF